MVGKRVSRRCGRRALAASIILGAAFCSLVILAYNPEQDDVGGTATPTKWPGNSVTWSLNPATPFNNVNTTGGLTLAAALGNSFASWQNAQVNGQPVVQLTVTQGPPTALTNTDPSSSADCVNIVSFGDTSTTDFSSTGDVAFAAVATAFGTPGFSYTCTSGGTKTMKTCSLPSCIIDADIEFSPKQKFSTVSPTPTGDFDVQSVATHEIGHMLGLDHSGIAAAVMYPFGDTGVTSATLSVDDSAGMAFLYPLPAFASSTGMITGQVTMGGTGIFASHVVAIDVATGDAVIDGLTGTDGSFKLIGLPPGSYNVLALPLAPDMNTGFFTLSDFGGWSCGYAGTAENSPPCCDPKLNPTTCSGKPESNPTNYTGKFF